MEPAVFRQDKSVLPTQPGNRLLATSLNPPTIRFTVVIPDKTPLSAEATLAHVVSTLAWSLSQAATMNAPPCSDLRSPTFPRTSREPGHEMRTRADPSRRCGYGRLDRQGRSYGRILIDAINFSGWSMVAADEVVVLRYSGGGAESAGSSACAAIHYRPRCASAASESDIGVATNVPPAFSPGVEELKRSS